MTLDREAETRLVVTIERTGKKYRGRVGLGGHAEYGEREVVAERCDDVVRGLALFSAIALDAYFDGTAPEPDLPAPPARTTARDDVVVRRSTRPPVAPSSSSPAGVWALGFVVGQQGGPGPLVTELGVRGQLALSLAPRSVFGFGVHVGQDFPRSYGAGTLTFRLAFVRLDACPVTPRLSALRDVSVTACVLGDLGVQRAALEGTPGGRAQVEAWAAVGAVIRSRIAVSGRVELQISAGALAPLRPLDFSTRASGIVYSTPSLAPLLEIGLALPFR